MKSTSTSPNGPWARSKPDLQDALGFGHLHPALQVVAVCFAGGRVASHREAIRAGRSIGVRGCVNYRSKPETDHL